MWNIHFQKSHVKQYCITLGRACTWQIISSSARKSCFRTLTAWHYEIISAKIAVEIKCFQIQLTLSKFQEMKEANEWFTPRLFSQSIYKQLYHRLSIHALSFQFRTSAGKFIRNVDYKEFTPLPTGKFASAAWPRCPWFLAMIIVLLFEKFKAGSKEAICILFMNWKSNSSSCEWLLWVNSIFLSNSIKWRKRDYLLFVLTFANVSMKNSYLVSNCVNMNISRLAACQPIERSCWLFLIITGLVHVYQLFMKPGVMNNQYDMNDISRYLNYLKRRNLHSEHCKNSVTTNDMKNLENMFRFDQFCWSKEFLISFKALIGSSSCV